MAINVPCGMFVCPRMPTTGGFNENAGPVTVLSLKQGEKARQAGISRLG
jgi:hypothetical protein